MLREAHSTPNAPAAIGPYSQAFRMEGRLVFLSGQIPLTPDGTLVEGDTATQARQVMENIRAILESMNLSFAHVVKTTIFLRTMDDFAAVNDIYGRYFEAAPPARSTVAVAGLPRNVDVEIECIAVW